jgi:hypothetical protein
LTSETSSTFELTKITLENHVFTPQFATISLELIGFGQPYLTTIELDAFSSKTIEASPIVDSRFIETIVDE